jgi:hypothetical protein
LVRRSLIGRPLLLRALVVLPVARALLILILTLHLPLALLRLLTPRAHLLMVLIALVVAQYAHDLPT